MIVITGGSGFIGSNLVKFLNDNNEKDILVVEELDSYVKKFENLKDLNYLDCVDKNEFIKDKMEHFPHYAGDIETLLLNIKIAHCKRVFGKQEELQRVISFDDVIEGQKRFVCQKGEDVDTKKKQFELVQHLYT